MPKVPEFNPRLLALLGSLVIIVLAGYGVRQRVTDETIDAFRWVEHTHEVRANIYAVSAAVAEMQAAAYAVKLGRGDTDAAGRFDAARAQFAPLLDQLRDLTRDNPAQQERIGFMRGRIEERVARLDRAMASSDPLIVQDPEDLPSRIPVEELAHGILAEEERLASERQVSANRHVAIAAWVTIGTALAQILLLGGMIWIAERQVQRRITAESDARLAVGRARLIVESVREPIAVVAGDLSIVQMNRAFGDFYGVENGHAGTLNDLPAWRDSALRQRLADVVTMRRELWDYETLQVAVGNTERHVVVNARPMLLPDRTEAAALVTVSDITARKRSEDQVMELNRQLSGKVAQVTEVNRELEAFSYSVSHDLRAPLRHIAGFADKLRAQIGDDGGRMTHYCSVISDSARRMSALIEDLLAYSRLGRHALRLQPVDLQSLVDEVRSTLASAIEGRDLEWSVAPLPVVVADASMLRLVWQNLIDNAIKYTGGREHAKIEIGFNENADERVFHVRDNGAGFDMQYVDKLFGVFQRLHKASAFEGTGIGLASVRRIIARHGGRTWAEGVPDQGATMYFSLPRHDATA